MCNLITTDEKCVKCGICATVCPSCIIEMGPKGPYAISEMSCMSCGHCVAVCPKGALHNTRCPIEEQDPIPMETLDSKTAFNFLRMRRSIRNFKPDLVPEEKIRELLEAARYAPTAANSQGLYFIVISDKEKVRKIADLTAQWMEEQIAANSPRKRYFVKTLQVYRDRKIDIIARNGSQLIFALCRRLNTTGISNCEQAWAYAELYAPTIGLGTTIMGFIQTCAQENYQPLRDFLEVPVKQNIVGCLLVGYPKYTYHRLVDRQHLKVEFR
jgi:nitroreductase/NAD-dependent dihydropyrimidine dehydrogenase PreA subunit